MSLTRLAALTLDVAWTLALAAPASGHAKHRHHRHHHHHYLKRRGLYTGTGSVGLTVTSSGRPSQCSIPDVTLVAVGAGTAAFTCRGHTSGTAVFISSPFWTTWEASGRIDYGNPASRSRGCGSSRPTMSSRLDRAGAGAHGSRSTSSPRRRVRRGEHLRLLRQRVANAFLTSASAIAGLGGVVGLTASGSCRYIGANARQYREKRPTWLRAAFRSTGSMTRLELPVVCVLTVG
jgi:hypothetical protein